MIPLDISNPVIQAGLGLTFFGGIVAMLRSLPGRIIGYAASKLFVSCVIDNEDSIYHWVSLWLADRPEMQRTGALRVLSAWDSGPENLRTAFLAPGDGEHTLRFEGCRFWISISSSQPGPMGGTNRPRSIRIRCWLRDRKHLEAFLVAVIDRERNPDPSVTRLYVADGGGWMLQSRRPVRPPESFVLDGDLFERIVADAQRFTVSHDEYVRLGIPHRRGYLLAGPPGNGKSTLPLALAAALRVPVYVLSLGDPLMSDDKLLRLLGGVPTGAIVVAEDVDTVFRGREREAENKLTMSGLLNAIDGPLASEGRILVLTSNHPEVLDPALVRPGRVDMTVRLENATPDQARRMWRRFGYGDGESHFVAWAGDGAHSMASLQAFLLERRTDPIQLALVPAREVA